MVRTQIQLTEKQIKALKKLSSSQHLSVAELIRRAIDNLLKPSGVMDADEQKQRALGIAGKFRSGKRNISREHDKHLAEIYRK
jgi:hypothetical protein